MLLVLWYIFASATATSVPATKPKCGANETAVPCKTFCPPQECSLAYAENLCDPNPNYCEPGCDCFKNYLRNDEGVCVLREECPQPESACGANEIEVPCKTICPPQFCNISYTDFFCDPTVANQCTPGCDCIKNYLRNDEGVCVFKEECPSQKPRCGANETAVACKTICPPQACDISYTTYTCDTEVQKQCIPGCDCIENYLRNDDGVCVLNNDCPPPPTVVEPQPPTLPPPTKPRPPTYPPPTKPQPPTYPPPTKPRPPTFPPPTKPQPPTFPTPTKPQPPTFPPPTKPQPPTFPTPTEPRPPKPPTTIKPRPPRPPKPGCKGPEKPQCGVNEIAVACKTICPPQSCDISYTTYSCDPEVQKQCIPGCDCIKDHLRNDDGVCVLNNDCPPPKPQCGANETAVACKTTCPPQSCDISYTTYLCAPELQKQCIPGCDCMENYLRNDDGVCVLNNDCPPPQPQCGANETAVACKTICPPQSCDISYTTYSCDPEVQKQCIPGCDCIENYLRNNDGVCILNDECSPPKPQCGANETAIACKRTCPPESCDTLYVAYSCAPEVEKQCIPGCGCKENYLRNDDGVCILSEECPPLKPQCGVNEIAVACKTICPPQSCDISYTTYSCDPEVQKQCIPGCDCIENYLRNDDGVCVLNNDCPPPKPQCGANETAVACKTTCPPQSCDISYTTYLCAPELQKQCIPGCDCMENYLRNDDGVCVLNNDCPPPQPQCGANETAVACKTICPPQSCDISYTTYSCDPEVQKQCIPGCDCIENYLRNDDGVCILNEECSPPKPQCGANETAVACKTICPPQSCDISYTTYSCDPEVQKQCIPGCDCIENYLRNDDGVCILNDECSPPKPQCGANETAVACKTICPPQSCDISYTTYSCDPEVQKQCIPGCDCIENYLRNDDGVCILNEECSPPKPQCGANETAIACKRTCPPESCDTLYVAYSCAPEVEKQCIPGCGCKENYLRNDDGVCILSEECPPLKPQCGVNEIAVACKTICPPQSCDISYTTYSCDPEVQKQCIPGCDCIENYLRNDDGVCVLNNDCPTPKPQCGANETAVACKTICPPQSCDISYTTYSCDPEVQKQCIPGCDCIENYLRNDDGVCVLNEECPPPKPQCGANEIAVACKTICPPQSCDIWYTTYSCAHDVQKQCIPGCDCIKDYLRNDDGVCIFNEECPPPKPQCGANETLVACKTTCPPQACNLPYTSYLCDPDVQNQCIPGCDCLENYLRNDDGVCILNEECPPLQTVPIEPQPPTPPIKPRPPTPPKPGCNGGGPTPVRDCTYDPCTPTCSLQYRQDCPPNSNPCKCPEGTIISDQGGQCVPIQECQKYINCKGDYNATYTDCPIRCPSTCAKPDAEYCDTQCGKIGCQCDYGFILSKDNGECIEPNDCPGGSPCRQNETFVPCLIKCPNSYCPVDRNRNILICDPPYPCPSGCGCKANYRRLSVDDDRCILASECPPVECNDNEEWNSCPEPCFSDLCINRDRVYGPGECQLGSGRYCNPQCVCKAGFFRNDNDVCVKAEECSKPQCGANETAVACKTICPPQSCNISYTTYTCDPEVQKQCIPGCDCIKDYLRNNDGVCVLNNDCPPAPTAADPAPIKPQRPTRPIAPTPVKPLPPISLAVNEPQASIAPNSRKI